MMRSCNTMIRQTINIIHHQNNFTHLFHTTSHNNGIGSILLYESIFGDWSDNENKLYKKNKL